METYDQYNLFGGIDKVTLGEKVPSKEEMKEDEEQEERNQIDLHGASYELKL